MYITKQLNLTPTPQLDTLAHNSGVIYSKALVTFKRIWRKKHIWLSKYAMQKLIKNYNLHSQTTQAVIDVLYDNIASWRQARKLNPKARLPKKRKWYFIIPYKKSAIKLKDGNLILSNGKVNEPLVIPWSYDKPKIVTISFNKATMKYVLNAVYSLESNIKPKGNEVAGIDLGEIHIAVANVGTETFILNGRLLRSKRQYQNKVKAKYQKRMSKLSKGSRKYKKLSKKKTKTLKKLNKQINDILHKQTTKLVNTLYEKGVNEVAIGDLRNLRRNVDYGPKANQRIHQMVTGKTRALLTYKLENRGISVAVIDESYSSQTCPMCLKRHKVNNRNYVCSDCGFSYHRDGVGAINIKQKQKYQRYAVVIGEMTPPVGIRYIV